MNQTTTPCEFTQITSYPSSSSSQPISSEIQEQLNCLKQTIHDQERTICRLLSEKNTLQSTLDRSSEEREELQREKACVTEELNRAREELERKKEMTEIAIGREKEECEYEHEISQLRETIRRMQEEDKNLHDQLQRMEEESSNRTTISGREQIEANELEILQGQLQHEQRENSCLREEVNSLRRTVEEVQQEKEGIEVIRGKLERMLQAIREKLPISAKG